MALVGHWKLNEDTPSGVDSIKDYSGNAFDGTPNEELISVSSPTGGGLTFDGDSTFIEAADTIIATQDYPFTIAAWVKKSTDSGGVMVGISKNGKDSTHDIRHITGKITVRSKDETGSTSSLKPQVSTADEANYPLNAWHHIVGVWAGDTERHLYINGQLYDSSVIDMPIVDAPDEWMIGAKQAAGAVNTFLLGELSDVRVYDHALTAVEVTSLFDSLVTHLKLDEPTGTSGAAILDSSGNGLTGTPNAAITSVPAPLGYGITFNGSSDDIVSAAVVTSYPFSMSCWYKTASTGTGMILFLSDVSAATTFLGIEHVGSGIRMNTKFAGGATELDPKMTTIILNEWVFVVGVWADHNDRSLYINGKLDSTSTDTSDRTTPFPTVGLLDTFTVGAKNVSSTLSAYFNGQISDARIYERVLEANEIAKLFKDGVVSLRHRYTHKKRTGSTRLRARYQ